jgi:predicted dehydrogenase
MKNLSRRRFIQTGITGVLGLSVLPLIKGCQGRLLGASDTIRLGFIGLGRQTVYLVDGFHNVPGIKIVAGCDVYNVKRQRFEMQVRNFQQSVDQTVEIDTYEDYQDILSRNDIDAVVIATPDHWHAIQAIDACKAGKDIYLEKPLTFTIREGIELVKAVRDNNRVLATGSQQRSDPNFQHAVRMVQDGKLGKLTKINAWVGPPPTPYDLAEEPVPEGLNWDKWLGPIPYIHYNHKLNPPISLDPLKHEEFWANWRYYQETGGGFLTDWGAHNFDIAQWALGRDNSGPVEIIPPGVDGREYFNFIYDDGIVVANEPFSEDKNFGVKFWSDDAWLEVSRQHFAASDESLLPVVDEEKDPDMAYETGVPHLVNFIESIRTRRNPAASVETGHRSATVGNLGNIAFNLGRKLRWDPVNETFVGDSEAEKMLHREYRTGYSL